jgi:hypothetical protein
MVSQNDLLSTKYPYIKYRYLSQRLRSCRLRMTQQMLSEEELERSLALHREAHRSNSCVLCREFLQQFQRRYLMTNPTPELLEIVYGLRRKKDLREQNELRIKEQAKLAKFQEYTALHRRIIQLRKKKFSSRKIGSMVGRDHSVILDHFAKHDYKRCCCFYSGVAGGGGRISLKQGKSMILVHEI